MHMMAGADGSEKPLKHSVVFGRRVYEEFVGLLELGNRGFWKGNAGTCHHFHDVWMITWVSKGFCVGLGARRSTLEAMASYPWAVA